MVRGGFSVFRGSYPMGNATSEAGAVLPPPLLDRADLARLFRVGTHTVAKWESRGKIPRPIRVGKESRWTREQIDAFLRDGGIASRETAVAG